MNSSLRAGTVLGSYRIVAPLGAGGMGEVYRAHDVKLDRPVALKVLPAEVTREAERIRRFVQEAKAASSLSHPNIVVVHDIGEAVAVEPEGETPATAVPRHYIAMELVEGSTLRQLFDDRSVEPRTLLSYLAQAAEGLAKAHAAGIVHRDLKPENVMVTRDGYVKILDFGLAKLTEGPTSGSALAAAPTALEEEATRVGAVMGTIGYMSPEQAMGRPVDHRTDVFAFGCLLYEAATGSRPFTGESNVDVLHAIARQAPKPVEELAPTIPRALVRRIRRCLEKDPAKRAQSMKDLAFELQDLVEEWDALATPSGTVASASSSSAGALPARAGLGRAGRVAIVAGVAAIVLAVALLPWLRRTASGPESAARPFREMRISTVTSNGRVGSATLGADGRYLAYTRQDEDGDSLWLRQIATGSDARLVAGRDGRLLRNPTFTPDGNYLDYSLSNEQRRYLTAYRIPVLGGPPRKLVFDVDSSFGYSPDGRSIAFLRNSGGEGQSLVIADQDGSGERVLTSRRAADKRQFVVSRPGLGPVWSPDGGRIAVAGLDTTGEYRAEIVLVDAGTGAQERLGDDVWLRTSGLAWAPDGGVIVTGTLRGGVFKQQVWRIDAATGELSRITNDTSDYYGVSLTADGGALASVQWSASSTLWRRALAPALDDRQLVAGRQWVAVPKVADDGTLFFGLENSSGLGVARLGPGDSEPVLITRPEQPSVEPEISRDGRTVVVRALQPDGKPSFVALDRDGGAARRLEARGVTGAFALAPDGNTIAVRDERGIWLEPLAGGGGRLLVEGDDAHPLEFSPDGTHLAYHASEMGEDGLARPYLGVVPVAGGEPVVRLPRPEGPFDRYRWAPDGEAFTARVKQGESTSIWRVPLDGGEPSRMLSFDRVPLESYAFSADGETLWYTRAERTSDAVLIESFR
jgi:serine/threonine protein kinase/Tol biopolymer transport system component